MIATKINVIENNDVGLVFGLDSLRAHRCNVMIISKEKMQLDAIPNLDHL